MSILNAIATAASSSGYAYEKGEYTPTAATEYMTIPFAKNHPTRPAIIVLIDGYYQDSTASSATATLAWTFVDWSQFVGVMDITQAYGFSFMAYRTSNIGTLSYGKVDLDTEEKLDTYATRTQFKARAYWSSAYYFKANHTYKWIAIWL